MAENRLMRAWGLGCARSLVIRLVVGVFVTAGFIGIALLVPLLPIPENLRILVWAGLVVLFMVVVIATVLIWAIGKIRQRAVEMDDAFVPLGLQGRSYMQNGRQYHGHLHGYPLHVYFYRGPTLQIYLDLPLHTRLSIGRRGALERLAADLIERKPLTVVDPEFKHLVVYPIDREWGRDLLADHRARAAILRLTREDAATELRSLSVQPNALLWQSRYIPVRNINPETVRDWVNDLWELARIAQGLHPPTVTADESGIERSSRTDRGKITRWALIGTCGFFSVMTVCILAITAIIIYLEETGLS